MSRLRQHLTYANVVSTLCLVLLLGGGAAIAAQRLPSNSVGSHQIRKGAVRSAKIHGIAVGTRKLAPHSVRPGKIAPEAVGTRQLRRGSIGTAQLSDGAVTGDKVEEATLDVVPLAQAARELVPPENWHVVGEPGEPAFRAPWASLREIAPGESEPSVSFYKDRLGIVHLQGAATTTDESYPGGVVFELPPGFRPAAGAALWFPVISESDGLTESARELVEVVGGAQIDPNVGEPLPAGAVVTPRTTGSVWLDGISFRAES